MADPTSDRPRRVRVAAPARIHLGVLDLRRDEGRYFGGMGVALSEPRVRVELRPAGGLSVQGPASDFVERVAARHLRDAAGPDGARIRVVETIPRHAGLGSGTQLALAVGRGLDLLHGIDRPPEELARRLGRGERSAVGTWTFARGGFVLEGGVASGGEVAPLLCRFDVPERWRVVLVRPSAPPGLSGDAEEEAFEELPPPDPETVGRVAHAVLMELLPAVATGDLEAFGRAARRVERATGDAFRSAQGGSRFAHEEVEEAVEALERLGAVGAGQSSWGPTVYGFVEGRGAAGRVVEELRDRRPEWETRSVAVDGRGARERVDRASPRRP